MEKQERVVQLIKELQNIAKQEGCSFYVNASEFGSMEVRAVYIRNSYKQDYICIKVKEEEREVDGVKIAEAVLAYIPKREFDPLKHEVVGE